MEDNVKQVIIFRKDLLSGQNGIRKGKFAAQCCHASIGALLKCMEKTSNYKMDNYGKATYNYSLEFIEGTYLDKWLNGTFTKICLYVDNDEQLVELYNKISSERPDIPSVLITDCGLTEFHGVHTNTCVGIGPFWSSEIDKYTGNLKLL